MVQRSAQGHMTVVRQRNGKDGSDGTSVLAQYSANASSWHDTFQTGDKYMRTSPDGGKTWTSPVKIVGESGANGSYIDYAFAISAQLTTSSVTTAPAISGSWSDAPVSVTTSYPYLWCRMISVDKDGNKATARYVRITGEKGDEGTTIDIKGHVSTASKLPTSGNTAGDAYVTDDDGHLHVWTGSAWSDVGQFKGDNGQNAYVHIAYANSSDGSVDFTTDDTKADGHTYIGTYTDNTESDSTSYSDYHWVRVQGEQGASVIYLQRTATASFAQSAWNTLSTVGNTYTWDNVSNVSDVRMGDIAIVSGVVSDQNNIKVLYYGTVVSVDTSNAKVKTTAISLTTDGSNGVGVSYVDVEYASNTSNSTAPTSGWQTDAPAWKEGYYIWSRTHVVYTDSTEKYTEAVCITGDKGSTGNGVSSIVEYYYRSIYNYSLSGGSWSTTRPDWVDGTYLWTRSLITYTNGTTVWTTAICVTGAQGQTGNGISKIVREYYKSSSATSLVGGSWSTDVPTWENGYYIWTRDHIYYTNGTDSYTDPVNASGSQGQTGGKGTSVTSVVSYYVATNKQTGVTRTNTSGWSTTFPEPTINKPFVWKYTVTSLDNNTKQYSDCELIAIYQSGANPNLLDDTSFDSDYGMDAWDVVSHYNVQTGETAPQDSGIGCTSEGTQSQNAYYDKTSYCERRIKHKFVLRQILYSLSAGIRRIEPSTTYTFSFWAKGYSGDVGIYTTSSSYGFGKKELYLTAGTTYYFSVTGHIDSQALSDGKELRTFVFNSDWTDSTSGATKSTSDTIFSFSFTPKNTGTYYLQSYLYDNTDPRTGTATVNFYRVIDTSFLLTLIYPSCIDTSKPIYYDGVQSATTVADGYKLWTLHTYWEKHRITFTTKSYFSSSDVQYLLFRMAASIIEGETHNLWICMPKLEVGMQATAYIDSTKSLQGAQLRVNDFAENTEYQAGKRGEKYHDVVVYNDNVYDCILSYISSSTTPDNDTTHWKQGDQRDFIATKVLLAQNALIKILSSNQITVYDKDGNVSGGMQGNPSMPIFWAGAESPSDGTYQQNIDGSATYGNSKGEHILLDPAGKTLKFFNSSNEFVTEHNAKTFSTLDSIMPKGGTVTLSKSGSLVTVSPSASRIWYGVQGTDTDYFSSIWQASANGLLTVTMNSMTVCATTAADTSESTSGQAVMQAIGATATLYLCLYRYSDSAGTKLTARYAMYALGVTTDKDGIQHEYSTTNLNVSTRIYSGGYYRLGVELAYFGGGISNITTCRGRYNPASAVINSDVYSNMFFGNGIMLSKSTQNFFAAMLENAANMRMIISNTNYGLDVSNADGILAKRGTYWHKQPTTLFAMKIYGYTYGVSIMNLSEVTFNTNTTSVTATTGSVYRVKQGRYRIYFPTNWKSYSIGTKGICNVTAIENETTNGWLARVYEITDTYVEVCTSDDRSPNEGKLFVELKI